MPTFNPAIGKLRFKGNGSAILEKTIPLRDASGNPYSGRVNPENDTHETVVDLNGTVLAPDPNGYDPEGLVVRPDGTFWVSDEYGPFITHFDRQGRQTGRLSRFEGVVALQGGRKLVIPNDSDFGIAGVSSNTPPCSLTSKIVPATGKQGDGEFLEVDLTRLPAALDTATIDVRGR